MASIDRIGIYRIGIYRIDIERISNAIKLRRAFSVRQQKHQH